MYNNNNVCEQIKSYVAKYDVLRRIILSITPSSMSSLPSVSEALLKRDGEIVSHYITFTESSLNSLIIKLYEYVCDSSNALE